MRKKTKTFKNDIRRDIETYFPGLEIIEAKQPLRLQPVQSDCDAAVVQDPRCCVFANAAKRQYGASVVLFWKTTAYVDLIDGKGVRHIVRFKVPDRTRKAIEDFDRGKPFPAGFAFELVPFSKTSSLMADRKRHKAARKGTRKGDLTELSRRRYDLKIALKKQVQALSILDEVKQHTSGPTNKKLLSAQKNVQAQTRAVLMARRRADDAYEAAKEHGTRVTVTSPTRVTRASSAFDLSVRHGHRAKYNLVG